MPELRLLMEKCWSDGVDERPDANELVEKLERICRFDHLKAQKQVCMYVQ